jgi:hypothetical protein
VLCFCSFNFLRSILTNQSCKLLHNVFLSQQICHTIKSAKDLPNITDHSFHIFFWKNGKRRGQKVVDVTLWHCKSTHRLEKFATRAEQRVLPPLLTLDSHPHARPALGYRCSLQTDRYGSDIIGYQASSSYRSLWHLVLCFRSPKSQTSRRIADKLSR